MALWREISVAGARSPKGVYVLAYHGRNLVGINFIRFRSHFLLCSWANGGSLLAPMAAV
jgi:hypothetical protein